MDSKNNFTDENNTTKNISNATNEAASKTNMKIIYFTDPICSACWGIEPQLRKLKLEYPNIKIEYRMGGLLPDWSYDNGGINKPSDVATHWEEASKYYKMPIDGNIWLEDPLESSYPPSIAFKAAQIQGDYKAQIFLRRIREMVFLEKKNICKWEYLSEAGIDAGLDIQRLKNDFEHNAEEDFKNDLALAQQYKVRGFPTFFIEDAQGNNQIIYGVKPYDAFKSALIKIDSTLEKINYGKTWAELFKIYPSLTTREYSELSNTSDIESKLLLEKLKLEGKLKTTLTKNGPLWLINK